MWDRQNGPIVRAGGFQVPMPDGVQTGLAPQNMGCVPGSRMAFSVNPTNNDTIAIGGTTFKFVTSLGAAAAQVQIKILGSAALTLAALLDAINGVTTDTNWVEATTPFAGTVVADAVTATQLRLRWATKRGGLPMAAVASSTALTASITGGASAWSCANLTANGKSPQDAQQAYGQITITAAMITNTFVDIELEFQPTLQDVYVIDATGLQRFITDTVTIPANQKCLHLNLPGGAAPHVQANDIVVWWVAA